MRWLSKLFQKYELWVRYECEWMVVQIRRIMPATHLVFVNENCQEVLMEILHEGNEITLTADGRTASGKPAATDVTNFAMEWTVDVQGVVALSPITDTNKCKVSYVGPGIAKVSAKGDADLSATGTKEITSTTPIEIQAVAEQASELVITASPETPIP